MARTKVGIKKEEGRMEAKEELRIKKNSSILQEEVRR
jgi:hypothetical protein